MEDRFWLLTARHVIAKARAAELTAGWLIELLMMGGVGGRLPVMEVSLDDDLWRLADGDDLALARFPVEQLPDEHLLSSTPIDRVGIVTSDFTPEVNLVGRWGEPEDRNLIVTRRGIITTMQRPEVYLEIGPGEYAQQDVYLVDASIMPGMSGGPIFYAVTPPRIYGLISARQIHRPPAELGGLPEGLQGPARAIWETIGPVSTGLVYVIPPARIVPFVLGIHRAEE